MIVLLLMMAYLSFLLYIGLSSSLRIGCLQRLFESVLAQGIDREG